MNYRIGLMDMMEFNNLLSHFLKDKFPIISQYLKNIQLVQTIAGIPGYYRNVVHIPDEIKSDFSKKEIDLINIALADNNEYYSIAGLTMLGMLYQKMTEVEFNSFIEKNRRSENKSCLYIVVSRDDEDAIQIFSSWTRKDYMKAIEILNTIKRGLFRTFLDFFKHPDFYLLNYNGEIKTAYSAITGCDKLKIDQPLLSVKSFCIGNCPIRSIEGDVGIEEKSKTESELELLKYLEEL